MSEGAPPLRRGVRFAPSPTGTFHVGNLRTAWISWMWARALGEPWCVRYEDIDRPRVLAGARESQEADMRRLGLVADETSVQSLRSERHAEAFARAVAEGRVYPCFCSRRDVREALESAASAPHGTQAVYSGHCRALASWPEHRLPGIAWRFRAEDAAGAAPGRQDFIVGRTEGLAGAAPPSPEELMRAFVPAYNWACAIDDWDGAYRLLVRAWDLAQVADQQRQVQLWLRRSEGLAGRELPWIFHASLVTGEQGERLEKRTKGVTLAELEERGIAPEELVRRFEASFSPDRGALGPGVEVGEVERTLRLSELGL